LQTAGKKVPPTHPLMCLTLVPRHYCSFLPALVFALLARELEQKSRVRVNVCVSVCVCVCVCVCARERSEVKIAFIIERKETM